MSESTTNTGALWGGRFAEGPSAELEALSRSTHFDWRLVPYDLAGSRAHARALHTAGLLTDADHAELVRGLDRAGAAVRRRRRSAPDPSDEDVHGALERLLLDEVGAELGGRLRAGRSRNDQVATLFKAYLRDHGRMIADARPGPGRRARGAGRAGTSGRSCRAGRTCSTPSRCCCRTTCWPTPGRCSATCRGSRTGTPGSRWTRRTAPARWPAPASGSTPERSPSTWASPARAPNSIDGTAARDFVAEFAFVTAMIGVDVSRLAEEVILWATREFDFVRLHDSWSTGSSIMPQKKNPDIAELARGKAGRLIGDLTGLLATLKALPLAYNRDLQEDKEPVFDAVDTLEVLLPAFTGMVATARVQHRPDGRARPAGLLAGHRRRGVAGPRGCAVPHRSRGGRRLRTSLRGARGRPARPHRRPARRDLRAADPGRAGGADRGGLGGLPRPAAAGRRPSGCASSSPSWRTRWPTIVPGSADLLDVVGRPPLQAAPLLLGALLVHGEVTVRITEVEAYAGSDDPGSHAYRGATGRNAVMFGPPGHLYVYFTYGLHHCANVVCGAPGEAGAVLLRAGEVVRGSQVAHRRRGRSTDRDLARGPARLCQALDLDLRHNGADLLSGPVSLVPAPRPLPSRTVATGPRVGLRHAAGRPWRFWIDGEPTVSSYRPASPRIGTRGGGRRRVDGAAGSG